MTVAYDFERSFGYVLYEAARLMTRRFEQRARRLSLTRAQCHVLVILARHEGVNQARLAEFLDLEPISLARVLDRMEQAGWVERRSDPADRRARLLYMTEKAKPVFDSILEVGAEVRADALAGLGHDDRERLLELLQQVRDNLAEKSGAERALIAAGEN
ncbi:MAG TPA: MarR family transcriptional regulator [Stellaceae bacterium]|nr:MarR family transcriptional regulator [Stellaceae bacterium]